ncbi:MAG: CocE/NonD family hydrolase [Planctomycetia bacterium]|nr:CocE/NonD family hydrolase [Planctomycetia bacterium]
MNLHRQRIQKTLILGMILIGPRELAAQPPQAGKYSAPDYQVIEARNEKVRMRDGAQLVVDIFRPDAEGRHPAVLCQTPYNKDGLATRAKWFASRGYIVVNSDSRGRFNSEGEWDPFSSLHKTDGYDLVEWIAKQPWCNGRVGTYGSSYMGWTQWWTATQAPPSLKCIVPEVAPPDQFFNGPYQNGILVSWAVDWAGAMAGRTPNIIGKGAYGGFAATRDVDYRLTPYLELDDRRKHGHTKWFDTWIRQNTAAGDYWKAIAYQTPAAYARVQVPSLAISGWFDANFPGTPMNYSAMKRYGGTPEAQRPRMVIGPWDHSVNRNRIATGVDFGAQAIIDWDGYVCRWFDYHLKQRDNGLLNDPPVHVFVMGRNEWRAVADWPLPETRWTKFYFHSGGKANSSAGDGILSTTAPQDEPPDHYTYDPDDPTPSAPFANGHIDGPRDVKASAARSDVLVYTTPVLEEEVEVVGPIVARLFAASSARDTDWMVRLIDVHPDGTAAFLSEGVMRARHRDPHRDGAFNAEVLSTLEPDVTYPYTIEFWRPTGKAFAKGHRIRVEVSSSYFPFYLRNLNTGADNIGLETKSVVARQTIHHDRERASYLMLPIIPLR